MQRKGQVMSKQSVIATLEALVVGVPDDRLQVVLEELNSDGDVLELEPTELRDAGQPIVFKQPLTIHDATGQTLSFAAGQRAHLRTNAEGRWQLQPA
jgi:hypothetical protein